MLAMLERATRILALGLAIMIAGPFGGAGAKAQPPGEAYSCCFAGQTPSVETTSHFIVIKAPGAPASDDLEVLLEQAYSRLQVLFARASFAAHQPENPLVWLCFDGPEEYRRYSLAADGLDLTSIQAYYSPRTNRVAVVRNFQNRPAGPISARLVTHEAVHQMTFNCGLLKPGVMIPFWLAEGLATNMEWDARNPRDLTDEQIRCENLRERASDSALSPLDELLVLTEASAGRRSSPHYDEAWGFFRFLYRTHPQGLAAYIALFAGMERGARSPAALENEFARIFGDLRLIEREWLAFAAGIQPTPLIDEYVVAAR